MGNLQIFDVVELKNELKATILSIKNDKYKVEIVDKKGNSLGFKEITKDEIIKRIHTKK